MSGFAKALKAVMARAWVRGATPTQLAILRILLGGYALWYIFTRQRTLARLARSDAFLFEPVGLARFLSGPLSPEVFDGLVLFTLIVGVLYVAGVGFRVTGPLFGFAVLAVLSYRNSWSMIFHARNLVTVHVLILGFAPAADALSGARLWQWWRSKPVPQPALRYGWPIAMVCTATACGYFVAGVAKLAGPEGLSWAAGQSLQDQVVVNAIRYAVLEGSTSAWLDFTVENSWLFTVAGIGTLVLEVGAPAALLSRGLGVTWSALTFSMHWGIYAIMGIVFSYQLTGLAFVPFLLLAPAVFEVGRSGRTGQNRSPTSAAD